MILSPGAILRVGLLLLLAVVLQLSGLSQLGILGGHIDLDMNKFETSPTSSF